MKSIYLHEHFSDCSFIPFLLAKVEFREFHLPLDTLC